MLKLKNGPQAVADAAFQAGIAKSFPGVAHTLSEDGKGGPPNNGIVLGQYQTRPLDMASAYATLAASGVYHAPHLVQKVVNADGQVLFDAANSDKEKGEQRIDKGVADNTTAAMQPIAAYSRGHSLSGGRPSAAKTGTVQLGDTTANKDAWMVGYTPSLSTAVWVGTVAGQRAAGNRFGRRGLRVGIAVRHLEVDDGRCLERHHQRDLPQADRDRRLRRGARSAAAAATAVGDRHPAHASRWRRASPFPIGPPTTITAAPPPPPRRAGRSAGRPTSPSWPIAAVTGASSRAPRSRRGHWPPICVAPTTAIAPAAPTLWAPPWRMSSADPWAGTR